MEKIFTALSFDDVLLTPKFSDIKTRKSISIESCMGISTFDIPVISSPMDTVTEDAMVNEMEKLGGLGILHRYNTVEEQVRIASLFKNPAKSAVAIGVTGDFLERAEALYGVGVRILCLDVAHGHHENVKNALTELKSLFSENVHLMAGNVATLEAFNDLSDWGADSIRVGVGGGSICSTRIQTGHGIPTLQSVIDCSRSDKDTIIIADGGIKNSGDACKALAAGADFVMLGSMLSGTDETPGDFIDKRTIGSAGVSHDKFKVYRGMASKEAQESWRSSFSSVEGISTVVKARGPVSDIVTALCWGIKSGLSYSGANNLSEFRAKSTFIRQTNAGMKESSTHIINS